MHKTLTFAGLLLLASSMAAQEKPAIPATDVTAANIKAFIDAMLPNVVTDNPIRVVDVGGYHVAVYGVLRPKSVARQESNLHQTRTSEIYYILEGGGTLVTGGKLVDAAGQTMQGIVAAVKRVVDIKLQQLPKVCKTRLRNWRRRPRYLSFKFKL